MSCTTRTLMRFNCLLRTCQHYHINARWTRHYGSFSTHQLQNIVSDLLSRYIDHEMNFTALKFIPGKGENGYKDWDVIEQETKFPMNEIFSKGFEDLINFEESGTASEELNNALTSLASFLSQKDEHGIVLRSAEQQTFENRTVILANHLLSPLLDSREYSVPYGTKTTESCPCSDSSCNLPVSYLWTPDDTGLSGTDITLYHENSTTCSCLVPKHQGDISPTSSPLRSTTFERRCFQRTIKYSIWSRKTHFQALERVNVLRPFTATVKIPLFQVIALNEQVFDTYAYHPKDDIFLRTSQPVSLWGKEGLNPVSLMQLWFLIHYDLFVPSVNESDEELKSLKFGLHAFVGEREIRNYAHNIELTKNPFILGNIPDKFE